MTVAEATPKTEFSEGDFRDNGIRCRRCECRHCPAIRGTLKHFAHGTRRRRQCRNCGHKFWAFEQIVDG